VKLLVGLEKFARLVVERSVTSNIFSPDSDLPPTPTTAQSSRIFSPYSDLPPSPPLDMIDNQVGVSPKLFGLEKPHTGLYSPSSYMANRPSSLRTRLPGQVI
jgi:hypothetical protein